MKDVCTACHAGPFVERVLRPARRLRRSLQHEVRRPGQGDPRTADGRGRAHEGQLRRQDRLDLLGALAPRGPPRRATARRCPARTTPGGTASTTWRSTSTPNCCPRPRRPREGRQARGLQEDRRQVHPRRRPARVVRQGLRRERLQEIRKYYEERYQQSFRRRQGKSDSYRTKAPKLLHPLSKGGERGGSAFRIRRCGVHQPPRLRCGRSSSIRWPRRRSSPPPRRTSLSRRLGGRGQREARRRSSRLHAEHHHPAGEGVGQ